MRLTGKLKESFIDWLQDNKPTTIKSVIIGWHETDSTLFQSMAFALLEDFLFEEGWIVQVSYQVKLNRWYYYIHNQEMDYEKTKEEAITKAIQYLNDNY